MDAEKMDRGSQALKHHVGEITKMEVRQTRKGWFQECLGCEAQTEFKYFVDGNQIAQSLEDASCCCRVFCTACHPFQMVVKELNTDAEMITVDRPCNCPLGACKCCWYQQMTVSSGGETLGSAKEDCWYCVPSFTVRDEKDEAIYKIHPPTCCGGLCMNCCTEGKNCFGVCCKVPFRIYAGDQAQTGGDAPFLGKILKKPKSIATEVFTDANAFDVEFPEGSTAAQKGILIGMAVFINAVFFEGDDDN